MTGLIVVVEDFESDLIVAEVVVTAAVAMFVVVVAIETVQSFVVV